MKNLFLHGPDAPAACSVRKAGNAIPVTSPESDTPPFAAFGTSA